MMSEKIIKKVSAYGLHYGNNEVNPLLKVGMYVRCPIDMDTDDSRKFIMGQVTLVNEMASTVDVVFWDPFNLRKYYDFIPRRGTFPIKKVHRCKPFPGSQVVYKNDMYKVVATANKKSDEYYEYYLKSCFDGENILQVREKELRISFENMDYSPLKQLRDYELHNPSWFKSRIVVSRIMHILDNSIYGFKTLTGCRVHLMPHQIYSIVRCLEDKPCRYMLADEVGLGKTIEAGAIIKIMKEEKPFLRVLLIVPDPLVEQWRTELQYKFNLPTELYSPYWDDEACTVIPMGELAAVKEDLCNGGWDFCVVDETHRLLDMPEEYEAVEVISKCIDNLLLLSATPVQSRKKEYLQLLRLLDPAVYGNMGQDKFEQLLNRQRAIQKKVYSIQSDLEEYEDYYDTIRDDLEEIAQDLEDETLQKIVESIDLESDDRGIEQAKLAISYICEYYRIERRVIRNRREILRESMPKRSLEVIPYEMAGSDNFYFERNTYEALLAWVKRQKQNFDYKSVTTVIQPLVSSFFSSPWAFVNELEKQQIDDFNLRSNAKKWVEAAQNEHSKLEEVLADPDLIKDRLVRVIDYLDQEMCLLNSDAPKVVVFTRYLATLEKFVALARKQFGKERVATFCSGMTRSALTANADKFQCSNECKLMVCDELGGEGRNFQIAEKIIHLDLPWAANDLEQRIGRLDRIGRDKDREVISVVVYAKDTIEEHLLNIWNKGLGIFQTSLSGLEIILGELSNKIAKALLKDVEFGLAESIEDIITQSQAMKQAVAEEQYFDAAAIIYRPLSRQLEQMIKEFQKNENDLFAAAMMTWASQAGLIGQMEKSGGVNIIRFMENSFSLAAAKNTLLSPPDFGVYEHYPMLRPNGSIAGTFDRRSAINREDLFFYAPGDQVFDSIIFNALSSGAGRASAFAEAGDFHWQGLVFIWSILPRVIPLLHINKDIKLLMQFRGFLPLEQIFTFYPLDEASAEVSSERLTEKIINSRYTGPKEFAHLGKRSAGRDLVRNIVGEDSNLTWFKRRYPKEEWHETLKTAYSCCRKDAIEQAKKKMRINDARREVSRMISAQRASNAYFNRPESDAEELEKTLKAVLECIERPSLILDSAAFYWVVKKDENNTGR